MDNLILFPISRLAPEEELVTHDPPVADEYERSLALDTSASWVVEAPAGSGKTGLLMQRYLKLLAGKSVSHPDEVLAITFTRKATAELRARVLEQLEAAKNEVPAADSARAFERATRDFAQQVLARGGQLGWGLLEDPSQLRIRTIDAVCGDIASALPLLSGSGSAGKPVDDARPLYRLAARRTLMHLGGPDRVLHDALQTILLHRDGDLTNCETLLATMLAQREQWAELVPLDRASLSDEVLDTAVRPPLEANLQHIICVGLSRALTALPPDALHDLALLAHRMSSDHDHPADSPIAICAGRPHPPGAEADHLEHWTALAHLLLTKDGGWRRSFSSNHLGFMLSKAEQADVKALIDSLSPDSWRALHEIRALPPARYPDAQWRVAKALFRLLLHALAELKILFAERGECDFSELSLAAREVLREDGGATDLSAAAGRTLRHLLVDEMQDTSSAQYELLELLTQSWDGHSQTLFLVGDPKQSIYMFRQARVSRFLRVLHEERLGSVPIQALRLKANFRSQPKLVETFNQDFSRLFPSPQQLTRDNQAEDVPFVSAAAGRRANESLGVEWHAAVLSAKNADARRSRALEEAIEIRRVVEKWQQKPLPPGRKKPWRIAVLARARNHLAPVLAEFQSTVNGAPIPFRAIDVEQLGERQEVLDAFALTRALLHPADRIAWLAVLRAPWCGLGAADLLALTGEGSVMSARDARAETVPSLMRSRASHLSAEGQRLLSRAAPVLFTAQGRAGRSSLPALVERTWLSLGGDVILQPEQRANVQRYLALLRKMLEHGDRLEPRVLKEALKGLYAEPSAAPDAVEMMTIHKAKGLEWDVVLIPALERQGQISQYSLLDWLELDPADGEHASVLLAPIHEKGEKASTLCKWIRDTKEKREEAERKRLLYVACTRAQEELHLFAACERRKGGELAAPSGTLLKSFWPAAAQQFAKFTQTYLGEKWRVPLSDENVEDVEDDELPALAAVAEELPPAQRRTRPLLHRLPLGYDPAKRFTDAAAKCLPATPAAAPQSADVVLRPEGSFAIRAYGNTVHRFLELIADRMDHGSTADDLQRELPSWQPRLLASLRSEGLAPAVCSRESVRALRTLTAALVDPTGRWILTPKQNAGSETTLTLSASGSLSTMRVDRTFLAGAHPLSTGTDALWIVDFKTTEQGSRSSERFEEEEREKYGPQLAGYATLLRSLQEPDRPIMLGLYYPAVPRFIYWPA